MIQECSSSFKGNQTTPAPHRAVPPRLRASAAPGRKCGRAGRASRRRGVAGHAPATQRRATRRRAGTRHATRPRPLISPVAELRNRKGRLPIKKGSATACRLPAGCVQGACISAPSNDATPPLFQNGYPSRRRSLVDDARFESLVVRQTKQSVLEEARQRCNGKGSKHPCVDTVVSHVDRIFP